MKKIISIVGARPQFVKAAILRREFDAHTDFHEILIHTGQHYDEKMSGIFFTELDIKPAEYHFSLKNRTHGAMTGEMLTAIEQTMLTEKPDACLVYGDTDSTIAGALAAAKLHIPLFHVEAGLRSHDKRMPEEINRVLTDHISDLLFCSTHVSIENLKNENITRGVHHVGDIMYDATMHTKQKICGAPKPQYANTGDKKLAICTLHRAETTAAKKKLQEKIDYLNSFASEYHIVLPLHPRTRNALAAFDISLGDIQATDPVGYMEMQTLLTYADLVFTDSGGLQKEAYFHGIPCVTLRDETEWVELVECGWNRLWQEPSYKIRKTISEYGEGNTGEKIIEIISGFFS